MQTQIIQGVLTLTSQTHISSPIEDTRLAADGQALHRTLQGRAVVRTMTRPVYVRGQHRGDIPVIPASTIKGRLRHLATYAWLKSIGIPVSETVALGMLTGAATGKSVSREIYRDVMSLAADHPFAALFGGGNNRLPGALVIHDAIPITVATLDAGQIPTKFADWAMTSSTSQGIKPVEPWAIIEHDHSNRTGTVDPAYVDEKTATKKRTDAMYSWQVMPIGTPLFFRISFIATNEFQIALLLESLRQFIQAGVVGGRVSLGYGRFIAPTVEWAQFEQNKSKPINNQILFDQLVQHDYLPPHVKHRTNTPAAKLSLALDTRLSANSAKQEDEIFILNRLYGDASSNK